MELEISIDLLNENGITLGQYLYLWTLYNETKDPLTIELPSFECVKMAAKKLIYRSAPGEYALTDKGYELFEKNGVDLFSEFIKEFPTRVNGPGGTRVLSPASDDTLGAQKLRKKWNSITKRNNSMQQKIISSLKNEVKLRTISNSLMYMRNAETWLNKATWEDYEYLTDNGIVSKPSADSNIIRL